MAGKRRMSKKDLKRLDIDENDFIKLESDRAAKARTLVAADRKHASVKSRQGLLVPAHKSYERLRYEIWKHVATQSTYRRRMPNPDEDPLFTGGVTEEERILTVVKALRGAKTTRAAEGAAKELLACIENEQVVDGVEMEEDEVIKIVWQAGFFRATWNEESYAKKKEAIAKALAKKRKKDTPEQVAQRLEEQRGKIRILVQNAMRKDRRTLVSGDQYQGAFVELYAAIKKDLWDEDDDPEKGTVADWTARALPDVSANA